MTACSCPLPWKSAICLQFDKTRLPLFRFRTMPSQNTIIKQWSLWAAYNKMIQRRKHWRQGRNDQFENDFHLWERFLLCPREKIVRLGKSWGRASNPFVPHSSLAASSHQWLTGRDIGRCKSFDLSRRWQNVKSNQLWSPTSYDMSQLRRERRAHIQMLLLHNAMYILAHSYSSYTYSHAFIFIHTHSHTVYFDLQHVKLSCGSTRSYLLPSTTYKILTCVLQCATVCYSV